MKKIRVLCGATLLAASVGVNAEIKPVDNTELAQVDGQLGLVDTTRTLFVLNTVRTHEKGDYAAQLHAFKAHAHGQMADHVADVKRNFSFVKMEAGDHLADLKRVDTSLSAHVGDHIGDIKRKTGHVVVIGGDHISDEVQDTQGVWGVVKAY